jgi:hypothetical protein
MIKRYIRPLSPLERYSLVLNRLYRYHVDGIVEGQGEVDPVALQAAVNLAAQANPAIRVRLHGLLRWTWWVDSGIAPKVFKLPLSNWNGQSEMHTEFLQTRLDPMKGQAVADVLIVPCTDGFTRIVFRSVHAAIDGRGLMHWVAEVCRAMRGEDLQGSNSRLTDLEIQAAHQDQVQPEINPKPAHCIPVIPPDPVRTGGLRYVWRRVVLPSNVNQLLPKAADFFARYARSREPGEVGFTIPVDYRGLRTTEMGIGNMTGYLRLQVEDEATPRKLMHQIATKVKAFVDCRSFPGIKTLRWLPVWFMLRKLIPQVDAILHTVSPALPSGGLVSMGSVNSSLYSFPGFAANYLYGIPGAVGKLNVIFINYPEQTVVSFSAPATYNGDGQLDRLVKAFTLHFSQ